MMRGGIWHGSVYLALEGIYLTLILVFRNVTIMANLKLIGVGSVAVNVLIYFVVL